MLFGTLPPEINSGRMYSGPGSGPLLAAAAAWDGLATELSSAASAYRATISALTEGAWQGPTALAMAAAATPYVTWMSSTGAQAAQTAAQARAAASAYEVAHAATVPPWVVAANRTLLMSLVATNILGQNTAAIAATEAHYAEMWAQDAAAMDGYAASAAGTTQLSPLIEPPQVAAAAPLSSLAEPAPAVPIGISAIIGVLTPELLVGASGVPWLFAMQNVMLPVSLNTLQLQLRKAAALGLMGDTEMVGAAPPVAPAMPTNVLAGARPVTVGLGRADSVGALSIPRNWTTIAAPVTTLDPLPAAPAATALALEGEAAMLGGQNAAFGGATAGTVTGRALGATGAGASRAIAKVGKVGKAPGGQHLPTTTIVVIPEDD